jgi:hypothetical protein
MDLSSNRHVDALSPAASALERMKHVTEKVCLLWGQREFEVYVNRLIMDSRDGTRQGLPWEAAQELLFLAELSIAKRALKASEVTGVPFGKMFADCLAQAHSITSPQSGAEDPWADPRSNQDVGQRTRGRSKPVPLESRPAADGKSWWHRLFG